LKLTDVSDVRYAVDVDPEPNVAVVPARWVAGATRTPIYL